MPDAFVRKAAHSMTGTPNRVGVLPELTMRVEHETAAIESIERGTAVTIGRAAQPKREVRERLATIAHAGAAALAIPGARRRGRRLRSRFGCRGATRHEQENQKGDIPHDRENEGCPLNPRLTRCPGIADLGTGPAGLEDLRERGS